MSAQAGVQSMEEQAAYWFLRLRDPEVSADEIQAALDWQEERPEHQAALERVQASWHLGEGAGAPALPDLCSDCAQWSDEVKRRSDPDTTTLAGNRRRFGLTWRPMPLLAAAAAAVAVVTTIIVMRPDAPASMAQSQPVELVRYATTIGEVRNLRLVDGSEVTLSGASAVSVEYSGRARRISLTDGEAFFKVAQDPARPFVVTAASGQVTALGTEFDVRRGLEGVTVTVVQGAVQVDPVAAEKDQPPPPSAKLHAGYQLTYSGTTGAFGNIARVTAEQSVAWRNGKLIFVNRSLADIAIDLNRYSSKSIAVEGEEVRSLRFTGVIVVAHLDDWVRALAKSLPVRVVEREDRLSVLPKNHGAGT